MYTGKNGVHDDNVEVMTFSEIYKVSVSVCFVPEGQITHPLSVIVG
jgi:hypothetical protein